MLWRNFFLVCFLLPACLEAGLIKIPVTADAGVSSVVGETDYNSGASVSVPIRQNQCWQGFETKAYLMRFDTSALRGHAVQRAWLNVFLCRGDLYGIGLCTVLAEWSEGSGVNGQTGRGGASWNWAIEPQKRGEPAVKKLWSWPGSGIYSVSWAHPDARYHHAGPPEIEKKNLEGGITALRIPVAPELVAALATGLAKGLVLTDDKGQIAEAYSLKGSGKPYRYDTSRDIYLYTREIQDPSLRPFLEVETAPGDQVPPGSAGPLEVSRTEPADPSVTVSFTAPGDDGNTGAPALGYEVRYSRSPVTEAEWDEATALPVWSVPRPQSPGTRQDIRIFTLEPGTWHLGLRAVDKAGNHGIISSCEITVPEAPQAALARPGKGKNANNAGPVAFEDILELWACPDLCKVDPVTGNIMIDGENYEPAGDYKHLNQVWSGGKRTVYLEAARGEVAAFQLILARLGDTGLSDVKVSVSDLSGWPGVFRSKSNVLAYRLWYMDVKPRKEELTGPWERIKDTGHRPAWHSAACLPLERPFDTGFSLPSMDNLGQDQRCQAVWIDFTVPRNTRAGTYQGKVVISARELKRPAIVLVMLEVLPVSMPNAVTWPVEINTYSRSDLGPEHLSGLDIETEYNRYLKIERRYYQLAHQHRTTMNVLPYNQFGQTGYGFAPEIEGSGSGVRVTSWKEWDRRFAQYLNGRAFTRAYGYQGPGAGVPVHYMYLPFCENWPLPVEEHYGDRAEIKDRNGLAEWAKTSRSLEEAFSDEYKQGFTSLASQFLKHFKKKGFVKTRFQFYFNNKYYWKSNFFSHRLGTRTRGTSYWLLDEPVDYDDYMANRFFLSLAKQGHEQSGADKVLVQYRTDVSQPEMSRGLWDGYCNLWNSSGLIDYAPTAMFRMRRLPGEQYWRYGGGPKVSGRLADYERNFLTLWTIGATGALPHWNNLSGTSWFEPNDLALMFTGHHYAGTQEDYDGGIASVRLKAMRRAQQDVEFLGLLAAKEGWNRLKVRRALAPFADDPEAYVLKFDSLTVESLFQLRRAVVATLLAK